MLKNSVSNRRNMPLKRLNSQQSGKGTSTRRPRKSALHMRPSWKHRDKRSASRLKLTQEPQLWQQLNSLRMLSMWLMSVSYTEKRRSLMINLNMR